jgi:hypothetical protein
MEIEQEQMQKCKNETEEDYKEEKTGLLKIKMVLE